MADNLIRKGVLTPLFISVLVLSFCSIGLGIASAQTAVSIEPQTKTVDQGATFNLTISVDPAVAIAGMQCGMSFNSSLVTVNGITEGNLLSQGGAGTYFAEGTIDSVAGTVTGIVGTITTTGATVSTNEVFAIVSLTANAVDGTTGIDLSNVIVGDIDANTVDIGVSDGTVTVGGGIYLTPASTVTPAQSSPGTTLDTTTTPAPTPTAEPASAPAAGGATTPDAPATKGLPGFEGISAIAGLLAIGYVMMRQKR